MRAYLDDVIVFGSGPITHVKALRSFFERLKNHNLKLPLTKIQFGATDVNFMAHTLSPAGLPPNTEKLSALVQNLMPKDFKKIFSHDRQHQVLPHVCRPCPRSSVRSTRLSARGLSFFHARYGNGNTKHPREDGDSADSGFP